MKLLEGNMEDYHHDYGNKQRYFKTELHQNQKLLKKHHRLEIMFSTHISDNELYIVSIKNSYDSILKAKDLNRHFTKTYKWSIIT